MTDNRLTHKIPDSPIYPYLPRATVATTSARTYMDLLTGVTS